MRLLFIWLAQNSSPNDGHDLQGLCGRQWLSMLIAWHNGFAYALEFDERNEFDSGVMHR